MYTREQLIKLYKDLPEELKDAMNSVEETEAIWDICERFGIEDKFDEIQKQVSYILLGLIGLSDLKNFIETDVAKNKQDAEKIYRGVFRFAIYPVKEVIEKTYRIDTKQQPLEKKASVISTPKKPEKIANKKQPVKKEATPKTKIKDSYRELTK